MNPPVHDDVWNYWYMQINDWDWYPFDKWPYAIQHFIKRGDLRNQQRFILTVFLLNNGLSPNSIENFYRNTFLFDASAWRQIRWLFRKWDNGPWTYTSFTFR